MPRFLAFRIEAWWDADERLLPSLMFAWKLCLTWLFLKDSCSEKSVALLALELPPLESRVPR